MGSLNGGMFSSNKEDWETPQELFDALHAEWGFELDVCANASNHKCDFYYTEDVDGLQQRWSPLVCWMNPPYGREIGKWVKKAYQESKAGATVVCLLPARTDTAWWHDYCMKAFEIRLIRGRLRFVGAPSSAPFPSAIVIFSGRAAYDELTVVGITPQNTPIKEALP